MNSKKYFQKINFIFRSLAIPFFFFLLNCTNESLNKPPEMNEPKADVKPITPKSEYTEIDAGEWDEIKEEHLPIIKIKPNTKKNNIEIKVLGEFTEQHYIERIGIMDESKQDLAGESLKKMIKAEVTLTLDPIPENPKIKVYVKCNLHDLWTKPIRPTQEN